MEPLTIQGECQGTTHSVVLTAKGRIVLPDHAPDQITAELAAEALGAKLCPCVRLLQAWRIGPSIGHLGFRNMALQVAWERRVQRSERPKPYYETRISGPEMSDLYLGHLASYVRSADPKDKHDGLAIFGHAASTVTAKRALRTLYHPGINGLGIEFGSPPRAWAPGNLRLHVRLRGDWWRTVYLRGLTTIDGKFVLDVTDQPDGSLRVVAIVPPATTLLHGILRAGHVRWTL